MNGSNYKHLHIAETLTLRGEKEANKFASNVTNIAFFLALILTAIGVIFTSLIVKIFAPGFRGEALQLTVSLTRIIFPMFVLIILSRIITGILQSEESFAAPALIGIPYSLIIIGSTIFLSKKFGIYVLGWLHLYPVVWHVYC